MLITSEVPLCVEEQRLGDKHVGLNYIVENVTFIIIKAGFIIMPTISGI